MTNPNDPIYPQSEDKLVQHFGQEAYATVSVGGLTKREYFAALAMQGIIASPINTPVQCSISFLAVSFADALISELNKEVKP